MLAEGRLTTITGPAGIGKSMLAAHTLTHTARLWQGRLIIAQCWQSGSARGIRQRLCEAAGLPDSTALEDIGAYLSQERTLLLFDDVDPCRTSVARLVQHLLMVQPRIQVLATSRAPLGLGEETILRLGPLATEDAVLLYQSRLPSGQYEEDDSGVAGLCTALDNNPLAIVLAAGTDFTGMQKRHTSMYQAEDAGAHLLKETERAVWARLAVLPASFDLATAHAVSAQAGRASKINVDGAVSTLLQHSVLAADHDPGAVRPPRFRLTSSPRIWGMHHLQELGERDEALHRMNLHAQIIAAEARKLWHQGHQRQALDTVEDNWPLLEAQMETPCLEAHSCEKQLGTCVNLWFWWATHAQCATGLNLIRRHLPHVEPLSIAYTEAVTLAAHLAFACGDEASGTLLQDSWDAATAHGSDSLFSASLTIHAYQATARKDWDQARQLLRTADLLIGSSDLDWTAGPSTGQGWSHLAAELTRSGHLAPAAYAADRAQDATDTERDAWAHTHLLYAQAVRHQAHGRVAASWRACHTALEAVRHHGFADLSEALGDLSVSLAQVLPRLNGLLPAPRYPRELTRPTSR
ncbi:AAA family ATPase [Streptomyces sp. NPDC096013]|uniref:AAA family ATPase n=1 Tax=Streptomyces sp. NPDC096013 TaxID=3366069 RepID=UPI003818EAD1